MGAGVAAQTAPHEDKSYDTRAVILRELELAPLIYSYNYSLVW